jgi:hypothetical protein
MGFAMNCRHGWLMTPTVKVLLEGRGVFMRLGPRESHLPEGFFYCRAESRGEAAEVAGKRPIDRRTERQGPSPVPQRRGVEDHLPRVEVAEIRIIDTDEAVRLKMEQQKADAGKS